MAIKGPDWHLKSCWDSETSMPHFLQPALPNPSVLFLLQCFSFPDLLLPGIFFQAPLSPPGHPVVFSILSIAYHCPYNCLRHFWGHKAIPPSPATPPSFLGHVHAGICLHSPQVPHLQQNRLQPLQQQVVVTETNVYNVLFNFS